MADRPGTMTFYRREGEEVFRLESATLTALRHPEGIELFFCVRAKKGPERPLPGAADLRVRPNAEVSVFVQKFDPATLAGSRFEVPRSYDEEREDHVSCVYYHEHQDLNRIVVEVIARKGKRFHVRWTGTTNDIDNYDGSEPQNRLVIEGMFEFQGIEEA